MNYFSILSENKNKRIGEKRQMSGIVDQILISGLQDFEHYYKLNPIDIKINDNQILSSLLKYEYEKKVAVLNFTVQVIR